ncbi:hypothetical protein BaRGS_00037575 [Batillaria attramentaria]|uniref:Uncharacterized protein n=1 Tax=Batillaria attramentaria TaxID=370345 RepID=A0ABD0J9B0_9CAEN
MDMAGYVLTIFGLIALGIFALIGICCTIKYCMDCCKKCIQDQREVDHRQIQAREAPHQPATSAWGYNSRSQFLGVTGPVSASSARIDIAVVGNGNLPPPYTSVVTSQDPKSTPNGLPTYDEVVGNSAL